MKNITKTIITAVLLLLTISLFAQEDSLQIIKDERGNATAFPVRNGKIDTKESMGSVPADMIVKDSKGNELALDWHMDNTGLSIKDFLQHKLDYWQRVRSILSTIGETNRTVDVGMLYDYKVDLDKLDKIKAVGLDLLARRDAKKDVNYNFLKAGVSAEAVVIGEVVEIEKMNVMTTGFNSKLKIKVDEIIKNSPNVTIGDIVECGKELNFVDYPTKLNQKAVISLIKICNQTKIKYYPVMISSWWAINNGTIEHKPKFSDQKKFMPLAEFVKKVKEIVRINDADNFYKRSWKEKK